jgi:hypothetical protein
MIAMALELEGLDRAGREGSAFERRDVARDTFAFADVRSDTLVDLLGADVAGIVADEDEAEEANAGARRKAGEAVEHVAGAEKAVDAASREPTFSRDLIDTYFRQMGGSELLSREEEIALAKRIEAAQLDVLKGLCRVPMLIAQVASWIADVGAEKRRIDNRHCRAQAGGKARRRDRRAEQEARDRHCSWQGAHEARSRGP